jgi:disulfide bond formation protein DsbB
MANDMTPIMYQPNAPVYGYNPIYRFDNEIAAKSALGISICGWIVIIFLIIFVIILIVWIVNMASK